MLRTIELTIEQLDKSFETTYENAVAVKERFWAEAKESGKVYFRGGAISRRGNSVDIYWLRIAYKCSGQPIPDSGLSFSSATAGGSPSLN